MTTPQRIAMGQARTLLVRQAADASLPEGVRRKRLTQGLALMKDSVLVELAADGIMAAADRYATHPSMYGRQHKEGQTDE